MAGAQAPEETLARRIFVAFFSAGIFLVGAVLLIFAGAWLYGAGVPAVFIALGFVVLLFAVFSAIRAWLASKDRAREAQ